MSKSISGNVDPNCRSNHLVVVSLYEPRSLGPISNLLESLHRFEAGLPFDLAIVVNRVSNGILRMPTFTAPMVILERLNEGMNIGAWDYGWRTLPMYRGYLFLQDECFAKRNGWLRAFDEAAAKTGIGLVGESSNTGWERGWDEMRLAQASVHMRDHLLHGRPANRVDVYLDFMRRQQIEPGEQAGHLRSLVWYATHDTLVRMDGFKHGTSYGECIAAEIAATKQVEMLGLKPIQVDSEAFCYFGHLEWKQERPSGRWRHFSLEHEKAFERQQSQGLQRTFDRLKGLFGVRTSGQKN